MSAGGSEARHDERHRVATSDDVDDLAERLLELLGLPAPPRPAPADISAELREVARRSADWSQERSAAVLAAMLAADPARTEENDWNDDLWARVAEGETAIAYVHGFEPMAILRTDDERVRRELEGLGVVVIHPPTWAEDDLCADPEALCAAFPEARGQMWTDFEPTRFSAWDFWYLTM